MPAAIARIEHSFTITPKKGPCGDLHLETNKGKGVRQPWVSQRFTL
jgi:hypothetical protein